ncbi:MAG: hypothetical protein ACQESN_08415 [Thermotogota bacterium]
MSFQHFSRDIDTLFLKKPKYNKTQKIIKEYLYGNEKNIDTKESINMFFKRLKKKAIKEFELIENNYSFDDDIDSKIKKIQEIFFPENLLDYDKTIKSLREKRRINANRLDEPIIKNPYKEILLTANVLLTMPEKKENLPYEYRSKIDFDENQRYWYDHPIPLDATKQENEIIYGLKMLNKSISIETNEKVTIVLSISCTHDSLNIIAKNYLRNILRDIELDHLKVYVFTEEDTNNILDLVDVDEIKKEKMKNFIGVQGKYGRHYSFLKAISALWAYYFDSNIKGTFKIDLDQVFDQKALQKYTGQFAFDNFKDKLWGAAGIDENGDEIRLGMMAGALVNDEDIKKSIFESDVKKEEDTNITYDKFIFNSQKPQYISTIAEMGTRYKKKDHPIIRYHVTGGTNGILVNDLIKYKPFTPSFIGRAEDQAFILSVIDKKVHGKYLRYFHNDKLIMRHDKNKIIKKNIDKSKISNLVGDYERILILSHYVDDILDNYEYIKEELFPFTGCFITKIPYLTLYFRSLLKIFSLAEENENDAKQFLLDLSERLNETMSKIEDGYFRREYREEKNVWEEFYNHFENYKNGHENFLEKIRVK